MFDGMELMRLNVDIAAHSVVRRHKQRHYLLWNNEINFKDSDRDGRKHDS